MLQARAARWLGASPADVVLVPNATHGLNAAIASAVCPTCRCRGCPFCNPDGTPKPAGEAGVSPVEVAPGACIPFNAKDTDHRACQAHCSESLKGSHCETCKCKECAFCEGFRACQSVPV